MAGVTITGLHKLYGAVPAVRGVDLQIGDGEFTVLVGPSGCGKSTLLRTIAGLEDVSDGTIAIGGEVVNDMRPRDRDVAMVFQDYALYPHMTVERNIGFGLRARKFPKPEVEKRVDRAAAMLGITPLSAATRASCPGASGSAWLSDAPSCAIPSSSCSTSRSPTSTPSCATRCGAKSSGSTRISRRR
jgi:ABC-type sugar transport system ATPase subunit